MSLRLALLLAAAVCLRVSCSISDPAAETKALLQVHSLPEGTTTEPETVTQEDRGNSTLVGALSLARSNTDFAFSLYKLLAAQSPETNVIFSPLSVSMALAFLALGARGHTQTEILQGLKFNLTETPETIIHRGFQQLLRHLSRHGMPLQLDVNTAMFLDQQLDLQEGFREEARELYAADALSTDFHDITAAEKLINDYVELETRGKIKELVKGLDTETRMVLVNCLFFKAQWKTPFDPHDTRPSDFHVSKSRKVEVPMMNAMVIRVPYFRDKALGCTVVQLLYKASSACALLVLPDEGHMAEVEAALLPGTLQRWRDSLEMRAITLWLPKFSVSGDYDLKQVLALLGLRSVFSRDADLSGLTHAKNLRVSQVVHKAVLDVAEEGTEAAAATGTKFTPFSARSYKTIVNFNRPFLVVLLSEDTRSILFLGKVADPQQA